MNIRSQAEQDLFFILEDTENGFARDFCLCDGKGGEYPLKGIVDDIGLLFDENNVPVSARSITASFRLSSLVNADGGYIKPSRGWTARISDMSGKEWTLHVTDFKPDRSLGIGVLTLSLEVKRDN